MNRTITCPSGLSGEIRGVPGKAFEVLADKKLKQSGKFMDRLLDLCWKSTIAPGPYALRENGAPDWQKVLSGDRLYAFLGIRCATFGSKLSFPFHCGCGKSGDWEIDLLETLKVKPFTPDDLALFQGGELMTGKLSTGQSFRFQLSTGETEAKAQKYVGDHTAFVASVVSRVHSIDGVQEGCIRAFLDEEDMPVVLSALAEMDKRDGGMETSFDIQCPDCSKRWTVEVPFDLDTLFPVRSFRK